MARRKESIRQKKQQLQELVLQQIAYKNLVQRNKSLEQNFGAPPENSTIQLPFVIVNTDKKTVIDCSIANDKSVPHSGLTSTRVFPTQKRGPL